MAKTTVHGPYRATQTTELVDRKDVDGKLKLSRVPMQIVRDIAEVMEYGQQKYGDCQTWRNGEAQTYVDAMLRHALLFGENPNGVDEESGMLHLHHLAWNVAVLCHLMREVDE